MKRKSDSSPDHRNVRTRPNAVLGKHPLERSDMPAKRTRANAVDGYVPTVQELQMAMQEIKRDMLHVIAREQAVTAREHAVLDRERRERAEPPHLAEGALPQADDDARGHRPLPRGRELNKRATLPDSGFGREPRWSPRSLAVFLALNPLWGSCLIR